MTIDAELGYEAPNFILRSLDIDFGDSYFNHSNRLVKLLLNQSLWVMKRVVNIIFRFNHQKFETEISKVFFAEDHIDLYAQICDKELDLPKF